MLLNKQQNCLAITILVIMLSITGMMSTDIYVPSMPLITHALHSNPSFIKLTITMYLLGFSLSPLLFGHISDRIGRKPILILFAVIALVGIILAAIASNVQELILGRIIQGIGFGITTSLTRTIFLDIFEGVRLAQMASLISFLFSLSPSIAPILGGYIQVFFGWRAVFIFLGIYLFLMLILFIAKVPETIHQKNQHATKFKVIVNNYKSLLIHKRFLGYVTSSSMAFSGAIVFYSLSPFILQHQYHLSVVAYGWVIGIITVMMMISRLINIPLLKYISADKIIIGGLFTMLLASLFLVLAAICHWHHLNFIVIPMMLFVLGSSIIFSNASANALTPFRHIGGVAGALFGSLQSFGAFIAGLMASLLADSLMSLSFALFAVSSIALIVFFKTCIEEEKLAVESVQ